MVYGAQGQELADLHEKVLNLESRLHDVEGRVADKLDTAVFYEAIALHDERQIAHDQEFLLYIKEDLATRDMCACYDTRNACPAWCHSGRKQAVTATQRSPRLKGGAGTRTVGGTLR